MKCITFIASILLITVLGLSSCSNNDDDPKPILMSPYPFSFYLEIVDADGRDLLNTSTEGNYVDGLESVRIGGVIYRYFRTTQQASNESQGSTWIRSPFISTPGEGSISKRNTVYIGQFHVPFKPTKYVVDFKWKNGESDVFTISCNGWEEIVMEHNGSRLNVRRVDPVITLVK